MSNAVTKADIYDLDFFDAGELTSDESVSANYLTTTVVSTTAGTKTVVVNALPSGEGITARDAPVEIGDLAIITGTSGGLGDGQFTVASIVDDVTFTVTEVIGTSTGGSVTFRYSAGAKKVGFNPVGTILGKTQVSTTLLQLYLDTLLENDPNDVGITYSVTYGGGLVTAALWKVTSSDNTLKTEAYTYASQKITTIVTKVYDPSDGVTIKAQATRTYSYVGNRLSSVIAVRDI